VLSLNTARALRQAGLAWKPAEFDFFAVPDRGLDERRFVISEMPAAVGQIQGMSMVTFEGAVEWALDYVPTGEVLWLPSEEQLRGLLAERLAAEPFFFMALNVNAHGCRCEITFGGQTLGFQAADGSEAYAAALLYVLRSSTVH
jgi:hypothetical protein